MDENFGKNPAYLKKLGAPYWASQIGVAYSYNIGGIRVSPDMGVLNAEGYPIPGLYAAGCDAGGVYGDSYDEESTPCGQAAWVVNGGRIAARSAKAYLKA